MHTDTSLKLFEQVTAALGAQLRQFEHVVCPEFATKETQREYAAHLRSEARVSSSATQSGPSPASASSSGRRACAFHLKTIKHHSLGDYPFYIREYGTTDSYTTKIVSTMATIGSRD